MTSNYIPVALAKDITPFSYGYRDAASDSVVFKTNEVKRSLRSTFYSFLLYFFPDYSSVDSLASRTLL
jgi:hypothetical protein